MKASGLRNVISAAAVLLATAHLAWPTVAIDGVTLALLGIAVLPWLAPLFKSLEFPGGVKVEFHELEKTGADAGKAGLLAGKRPGKKASEYSFELIANEDPNLALAGLRIEIERRLRNIAESRNIAADRQNVPSLMRRLSGAGAITAEQRSVLADMIGLLNSAVHGARVDTRAVDWALETGPRLLGSLDAIAARGSK